MRKHVSSGNRLVYQNWIVDLGGCPEQVRSAAAPAETAVSMEQMAAERERKEAIRNEVAAAMLTLPEDEKEFIERFYYIGQTYGQIAAGSGRAIHKLEAMHKRALKKLRTALQPVVARLYGLEVQAKRDCVICSSQYRRQIDRLIADRNRSDTWKAVIKTLKQDFGIRIGTPQVLIGHEKYH